MAVWVYNMCIMITIQRTETAVLFYETDTNTALELFTHDNGDISFRVRNYNSDWTSTVEKIEFSKDENPEIFRVIEAFYTDSYFKYKKFEKSLANDPKILGKVRERKMFVKNGMFFRSSEDLIGKRNKTALIYNPQKIVVASKYYSKYYMDKDVILDTKDGEWKPFLRSFKSLYADAAVLAEKQRKENKGKYYEQTI